MNGEEGLYNALMDAYDLILLDIMLPSVNGIEILKEIKKNNIKFKVIQPKYFLIKWYILLKEEFLWVKKWKIILKN